MLFCKTSFSLNVQLFLLWKLILPSLCCVSVQRAFLNLEWLNIILSESSIYKFTCKSLSSSYQRWEDVSFIICCSFKSNIYKKATEKPQIKRTDDICYIHYNNLLLYRIINCLMTLPSPLAKLKTKTKPKITKYRFYENMKVDILPTLPLATGLYRKDTSDIITSTTVTQL